LRSIPFFFARIPVNKEEHWKGFTKSVDDVIDFR